MGLRRVRGVRSTLPTNTILGRRSGGKGAAEMLDLADVARDLETYGAGSSGSTVGLPTGGLAGQVLAIVAGVATWTYTTAVTALGIVTSGTWRGTKVDLAYGGTNADLSATGGASKVLKQTSVGAAVTVAQLAASDLSNGTTGSGAVVLASAISGFGSGTVTSVSMTVPVELSVAGSPVTTTGTLAVTWANQADKTLLANITGGSAVPSFSTLTAILDHDLGNTNDQIASRKAGAWTARNLAELLVAGTGVTLSGSTTITINASGSTTTNVQPNWPAPRMGNVRADMWGDVGQFSNDGGTGTGPIGSGPSGGKTIQWNTPRRQGQFHTFDGVRWAAGTTINFNSAPIEPPSLANFVQVCGADGLNPGIQLRGYGNNADFFGTRANGTNAAKTGVVTDDILFVMGGAGYTSAGAYTANLRAQIRFNAAETFSSTAQGGYISVLAGAKGASGNPTEVARFWPQGCWLLGTNTNDSAAAGNYGEFASGSGSGVSITTNTAKDVATVALTAGDWDIDGVVTFAPAGTTTVTKLAGWISSTANTDPGSPNSGAYHSTTATFTTGAAQAFPTGTIRLSLSGSATISLGVLATFATSTMTAGGFIRARRVR